MTTKEFHFGDRVRFDLGVVEKEMDISDERIAHLKDRIAELGGNDSDPELEICIGELRYILILRSERVYKVREATTQYMVVENQDGVSRQVQYHDILLEDVRVPTTCSEFFPANWFVKV